jgi:hypothetical protein
MHDERGHSFGGGRTIPISQPQRQSPPGQRRAELLGANYDNAHPKAERWQPNTSAKIRVAPRSKIGPVDCRFGSKAAAARSNCDVRFTPNSGHPSAQSKCPLWPNRRHRLGYSITSSARARSVGGTSMPSVLAVFRLTTSSNVVGCCTGRLAGFSPLRMRPA